VIPLVKLAKALPSANFVRKTWSQPRFPKLIQLCMGFVTKLPKVEIKKNQKTKNLKFLLKYQMASRND